MSEEQNLGYFNKKTFELFAKKTPDKCPQCGERSNFTLIRETPEGPFVVVDRFYLRHSCGWEKDVTPIELA